RVRDRDDVAALVQLEVGVADADVARADEHLVRGDRRGLQVTNNRTTWFFEHERFHVTPSSLFDQHLDLVRRARDELRKCIRRRVELYAACDDSLDRQI